MARLERVTEIVEETDWSVPEEEYVPDPYFYVMGLDPGGTTGVAVLRINTDDDTINPELVYLHQIADGRYGFKNWFNGSKVSPNVVIVSEKWKERNVKGADREPQYIEGSMHMLWDDENIVYQFPDQKELVPDEWLKENNLWTPDKRHQMDALKHAFAYLRNDEHSATLESLSGDKGDGEGSPPPMAQPGEAEAAQIGDEAEAGGPAEAQPGEGEGEASKPQTGAEAMAQAMAKISEAAEAAAEELGKLNAALKDDRGGNGPGNGGGEGRDEEWDSTKEGFKGERSKRSRNGAFAGFNPDGYDDDEGETILFDD